jgi:alkylhydroperoxidase family enzyme
LLRRNFFNAAEIEAIVHDFRTAGLKPVEVAVMALAQKVTLEANSVTIQDIDGLRAHGLADEEILDVIMTAALRAFFSKALDALGAEPDPCYRELEPDLVQALAIGRSFK